MAVKLHVNTVSQELMKTLKILMEEPALKDFYLVGGTALALRFGHRVSVDIDLFTNEEFDSFRLAERLTALPLVDLSLDHNTILCFVNGVKVDLMTHNYPLLEAVEKCDGIRLLSIKDLAALKLNAISRHANRKDFWDLATLLDHFTLREMISFFEQKYRQSNKWHLLKSLQYFDDADREEVEIKSFDNRTWEKQKNIVMRHLIEEELI